MKWRLDQLVPIKEAARSLPRLIERNEPLVLTRRGEPVAVLTPVAQFERLIAGSPFDDHAAHLDALSEGTAGA